MLETACALVLVACAVAPSQPPGWDEFERWLRERLPTGVCVEAVYKQVASPGRVHIGYDADSGAFYQVSGERSFLRDEQGRCYTDSGGTSGTLRALPPKEKWLTAYALQDQVPTVILADLVRRGESAQSVEPLPDGGYRARFSFPRGDPRYYEGQFPEGWDVSPRSVEIEVAPDGRLRWYHNSYEKRVYDYAPQSRPDLPITLGREYEYQGHHVGKRLVSFTYHNAAPRGTFSVAHVETLSDLQAREEGMALGYRPGNFSEEAAEKSGMPVRGNGAPTPDADWAWLATGAALTGLGGFIWWRRQRAA